MYLYQKAPCKNTLSFSVDNSPYSFAENSFPYNQLNFKDEESQKVKILLVDDHQIVRKGIRKFIKDKQGMVVVGEAADGKEAIDLCQKMAPDVVLMDVNMPILDGIEATKKITSDMPEICIIGLSMHHKSKFIEKMKDAGASAYISKTEIIESLVQTIRREILFK